MYQPGHTITPNVTEDEYGNIVGLDFDIDRPSGYDSRYENDYYQDPYGNTHHIFEDAELQEEGEWSEDSYNMETATAITSLVGGWDAYREMTAFLYQALDEQEINSFDALVDQATATGEFGELEEAIQRYYQFYLENAGQYQQQRYDSDEDGYIVEEDSQPMVQTVFDAVGGQEVYTSMLDWGEENLDQDQIDWYDSCMDSGDPDLISEAVGSLYELYTANY